MQGRFQVSAYVLSKTNHGTLFLRTAVSVSNRNVYLYTLDPMAHSSDVSAETCFPCPTDLDCDSCNLGCSGQPMYSRTVHLASIRARSWCPGRRVESAAVVRFYWRVGIKSPCSPEKGAYGLSRFGRSRDSRENELDPSNWDSVRAIVCPTSYRWRIRTCSVGYRRSAQ